MYDDSLFSFFKVGSDDSKCKEKINWCKFDFVMPSWPSKPRLNLRCWDYWWDRWGSSMAISRLKSIQQHFRLHAWTRFCFISSVNKYQDLYSYLFHQLSCISHLGFFFPSLRSAIRSSDLCDREHCPFLMFTSREIFLDQPLLHGTGLCLAFDLFWGTNFLNSLTIHAKDREELSKDENRTLTWCVRYNLLMTLIPFSINKLASEPIFLSLWCRLGLY